MERRTRDSREYSTQLSQLQDHASHHSFAEIDNVLVAEFGKGSAELFKEFQKEPLAAASLAQVHLATLHKGGERVAVKIQRPGLRRTIEADLALLGGLASIAEAAFPALQVQWPDNEGFAERPQEWSGACEFSNSPTVAVGMCTPADCVGPCMRDSPNPAPNPLTNPTTPHDRRSVSPGAVGGAAVRRGAAGGAGLHGGGAARGGGGAGAGGDERRARAPRALGAHEQAGAHHGGGDGRRAGGRRRLAAVRRRLPAAGTRELKTPRTKPREA